MKLLVICALGVAFCWPEPAYGPQGSSKQDMIDALMQRAPVSASAQLKPLDVDQLRKTLRAGLNVPPRETSTSGLVVTPNSAVAEALSDRPWINLLIYFDYDSAAIKPQSEPDLIRLAETLSASALAQSRFMVAGHSDGRGRRDYNLELSQRRAEAVQKFLVARAPSLANRLVAMGFGMEQLRNVQAPEDPSNRRVQLLNIGPAAAR